MKILWFVLFIFMSLQATEGMKNITLNTLDLEEVSEKINERVKKIKLKDLQKKDFTYHLENVKTLKKDIATVVDLKQKLRFSKKALEDVKIDYAENNSSFERKMANLYAQVRNISRESYYLVVYKLNQDYLTDLQNYLLDQYAITKIDQVTVVKENNDGTTSLKNIIKTTKVFGEMQIESLKDYTFRDKNLNIKLVKVTQYPFRKSNKNILKKAMEKQVDTFADDGVKIYQLSLYDYHYKSVIDIQKDIDEEDKNSIVSNLNSLIHLKEITKQLLLESKKIDKVIKKMEKLNDEQLVKANQLADKINHLQSKIHDQEVSLQTYFQQAQKIALKYNVELKLDTIENIIIVTPKVYKEEVELGEEKEFILRKTKTYLSKITINEISQTETLTNDIDLLTKNSEIHKMIKYDSIHFLPFIQGKKLGLFIFAIIEIQDKVTQENYVIKKFKYGTLTFVPINKGYKTIFMADTKVTIGIMKEFLETHRQSKYFDQYCLGDSTLPEGAKNIKNASKEFYDYPAVCMNIDRVEEIVKWLSKKTKKDLVIPSVEDWSYVASNGDTTDYCWGNETLDEMKDEGVKYANIYYEDDEDTSITPIKQYPKSKMGMYDMCGNTYELVKDGEVFMVKGNSYISYIEKSNAPAIDYGTDLNAELGLRVEYILGE
ncbi:Secreted protein with uncharacterized domain [hydrothermal vent metagenome]|uniref:Secreted protein with uncharacterized domain n=1 Tax=hydrothermal vent metagenome TaxID=652676 RepID=A0A1W1D3V8_9ZZZZ